MPTLIESPSVIEAAGNKPKRIEEYIGRVNSKTKAVSIARMKSPGGWVEPGQRPEFDEYTIVLNGMLRVESEEGTIDVKGVIPPERLGMDSAFTETLISELKSRGVIVEETVV